MGINNDQIRIKDLQEVLSIDRSDFLIVETHDGGTSKVSANVLDRDYSTNVINNLFGGVGGDKDVLHADQGRVLNESKGDGLQIYGDTIELTSGGNPISRINIPAKIQLENSLTSRRTDAALTAAMGRELKNMIPRIEDNLTSNDVSNSLSAAQGKILNQTKADAIRKIDNKIFLVSNGVSIGDGIDLSVINDEIVSPDMTFSSDKLLLEKQLTDIEIAKLNSEKINGVELVNNSLVFSFNDGVKPLEIKLPNQADLNFRHTFTEAVAAWREGSNFPIAFYGDSTVDGVGTTGYIPNVLNSISESPNTFTRELQRLLRDETLNSVLRIYNCGFRGFTSKAGLDNFDTEFGAKSLYNDTKIVGICFGLDDLTLTGEVDELRQMVYEHQSAIIDKVFLNKMQPFLVASAPIMIPKGSGNTGRDFPLRNSHVLNNVVNEVKKDLARKYNIPYIDLSEFMVSVIEKSGHEVPTLIKSGIEYSDITHSYIAGYFFKEMVSRTIIAVDEELISYTNQNLEMTPPDNKLTFGASGDKFKAFFNYIKTDSTDTQIMSVDVFTDKPMSLKAYRTLSESKTYIRVNGRDFEFTENSSESLIPLAMGLTRIQVFTGMSNKVDFRGFEVFEKKRVSAFVPLDDFEILTKSVPANASRVINVRHYPENASIKGIVWETSNSEIAYVNNYGILQGVSEGTCTITGMSMQSGQTVNVVMQVTGGKLISEDLDLTNSTATLINDEFTYLNSSKPFSPVFFKYVGGADTTRATFDFINYRLFNKPLFVVLGGEANGYTAIEILNNAKTVGKKYEMTEMGKLEIEDFPIEINDLVLNGEVLTVEYTPTELVLTSATTVRIPLSKLTRYNLQNKRRVGFAIESTNAPISFRVL